MKQVSHDEPPGRDHACLIGELRTVDQCAKTQTRLSDAEENFTGVLGSQPRRPRRIQSMANSGAREKMKKELAAPIARR